MVEPVRLAKRLAETVPCSRREAELFIEGGWVKVDGVVVLEPQFRISHQKIELHPDAKLIPLEPVTILFHQISGIDNRMVVKVEVKAIKAIEAIEAIEAIAPPQITVDNHASDDPSGIRPMKRHFSKLTPILPLETNASGLLVFTQDWRVVRKLVDDAATVEQEYIVEVDGVPGAHGLKQLNHGISFHSRALPPAKVSWQNETHLRFALKRVQPGQIAHMCQSVGLQVRSMKRIRIGKVSMAKLPPGQWRYLPANDRF